MIWYFTPYSTNKNLGEYYNACMSIIHKGDWACFTDGDAMFTTSNFGHQLEEIIEANPEYSLFTCMTNRVGTKYQCVEDVWSLESMKQHNEIGKHLQVKKRLEVEDITHNSPISGVLILLNKNDWFYSERFKEKGLLGVDNSIHYSMVKAGKRVGLMQGVYVQHRYRNGNINDRSHLM